MGLKNSIPNMQEEFEMKSLKKTMAFVLIGCLLIAAAACQGGGQESPRPTQPSDQSGLEDFVSEGITAEHIANYVIRYKVTAPKTLTNNDSFVTEDITTEYLEVGCGGVVLGSQDGGETFYFVDGGSCFSVTRQDDDRGLLNAHIQYRKSGETLDQLSGEQVCGYDTTHYYYKSGMFQIHMYVSRELDITLKYVSEGANDKTFEVIELQFGVVDEEGSPYQLQDMINKIPVPEDSEA